MEINKITKNSDLGHLEFIDGLRGIAILMVLLFHVSLAIGNPTHFLELREKMEHLSRGVQLFFILSAFTLFRSSFIRSTQDRKPVLSFYIRRFFRIMPLWWIAVVLYFFLLRDKHSVEDAFATAFMYFGFYSDGFSRSLLPVGWSLFVEETFYWIFPFLRKMITGPFVSLVFCGIGLLITTLWFKFALLKYDSTFVSIFPLGNIYAFFIGFSLFYLYEFLEKNKYTDLSFRRIFLLDLAAGLGVYQMFFSHKIAGTYSLVPLVVASFFKRGVVGKIMASKILRGYGKYCYSIYLFHGLVIFGLGILASRVISFSDVSRDQFFFVLVISFITVATWSFVLGGVMFNALETYFIDLGKKLIKKFDF